MPPGGQPNPRLRFHTWPEHVAASISSSARSPRREPLFLAGVRLDIGRCSCFITSSGTQCYHIPHWTGKPCVKACALSGRHRILSHCKHFASSDKSCETIEAARRNGYQGACGTAGCSSTLGGLFCVSEASLAAMAALPSPPGSAGGLRSAGSARGREARGYWNRTSRPRMTSRP